MKVTDAAIDAENITGVYLSVSEIQASANGSVETIAAFESPIVFNVLEYQNGSTFELGEGDVNVGTYDELRLILTDGSPSSEETSSYVAFDDETTAELLLASGTTTGYKVKGDFQVSADNQTDLVIDIDLRKALVMTGTGDYMLRPTARLVVDEGLGEISGSISDYSNNPDQRFVVYAYVEGEFSSGETEEPAEGETRFENSINSAVVANDGSYKLAFMEEGNYELIVSEYVKSGDSFEFNSRVEVEMMMGTNLLNLLELESNSNLTINLVFM